MDSFIDSIKTGSIENFHEYYEDDFLEEKYESLLPIHHACRYNHIKIVEILIEKGCNIEACGTELRRPIHIASRWGCIEVVKILINKKCNVEACDENDWRPIHFACNYGHVEVTQLLIDSGCNIEPCDNHNWRPIHFACSSNKPEIVQLLIEHKCDTHALTLLNLSPLDVAKQNNNELLIEIINTEILNPKMIDGIALSMNIMCNKSCDHKLCSASLQSQTFVKGNLLGTGGFGSVYRCHSSQTLFEFALKSIPTKIIDVIKIKNHINDNLKHIKHLRIVQYFGAVDNDKKLLIFMEFVSGCTLHKRISDPVIISESDVIHFTQQILEGLAFLHENGIIHRDIKPSNILLDLENNIKLVDFDLSRLLIKNDGSTINARTLVGTLYFSAPELFKNQPYKYPADIYSLGITILTMITRNLNYHDLELPQIVVDETYDLDRVQIPHLNDYSNELGKFLEELLNPDPLMRPSAVELLKHRIFVCLITTNFKNYRLE